MVRIGTLGVIRAAGSILRLIDDARRVEKPVPGLFHGEIRSNISVAVSSGARGPDLEAGSGVDVIALAVSVSPRSAIDPFPCEGLYCECTGFKRCDFGPGIPLPGQALFDIALKIAHIDLIIAAPEWVVMVNPDGGGRRSIGAVPRA